MFATNDKRHQERENKNARLSCRAGHRGTTRHAQTGAQKGGGMSFIANELVRGGKYCHTQVAKAIRRGILAHPSKFPCADCGKAAREYDHRDYNFPLVVSPVCRGCNARRGRAIPRNWQHADLVRHIAAYCQQRVVPWAREWCLGRIERMCVSVEKATNGEVSRHDIRPDIYPVERTT